MTSPKGWYPDPDVKPSERYWNGKKWTSKTRPISKPKEKSRLEKILETKIQKNLKDIPELTDEEAKKEEKDFMEV